MYIKIELIVILIVSIGLGGLVAMAHRNSQRQPVDPAPVINTIQESCPELANELADMLADEVLSKGERRFITRKCVIMSRTYPGD